MNECIYCKSTDIEKDLPIVGTTGSTSHVLVGPFFLLDTKRFLGKEQRICGMERLFADICKSCGGVKLSVKNVDKEWQKEPPSMKHVVVFQ